MTISPRQSFFLGFNVSERLTAVKTLVFASFYLQLDSRFLQCIFFFSIFVGLDGTREAKKGHCLTRSP